MNTEINNESTIDYETLESKFVELLHCDGAREYMLDFDSDRRLRYLKSGVEKRNWTRPGMDAVHKIPDNFVIAQAAERFFSLVDDAKKSLNFSEQELATVLNTTSSTVWEWDPYWTAAGMVADKNGVESLDELAPDSTLRLLIEKLAELSPTQNAALVDVCERVWRCGSGLPLDELCAELGMPLTD